MSANSYETLFLFISLLIPVLTECVSSSGLLVLLHVHYVFYKNPEPTSEQAKVAGKIQFLHVVASQCCEW